MTIEALIFLLVAGFAFGYSGYRFLVLFKMMKAQKGKTRPFGNLGARIQTTIANVLGQKAVLKKPSAGIMHALIFWGFLIITVGTLEQFFSTLTGANFEFLGEPLYQILVFSMDLFTTLVILAVVYAAYRRLIVKPPHLKLSSDALWILFFTGALMVSIFLMNAFHILGHDPWYKTSLPFSNIFAGLVGPLGFEGEGANAVSLGFKWVHMLLVLGFAVYIPHSKHLHIVAAGPNTFLKTLDRAKGMTVIDFEDESLEQYGAGKVTDLSWKDTLDMYSCTECGRCQELCPAWNTQKPLSPMRLVNDLKYNLFSNKANALAAKYEEVSHVIDDKVTEDVIWACTSCRACEIACPVFIEHTDKIYDIRRNLVMMESKFPAEVQTVFKNMETNATPWAFSSEDRDKWCEDLNIPRMADVKEIDVMLWVGCAGAYDERNKKVLRSTVSLLKKAGLSFAIMGKEESCTGDPARRIGNEYLFQTLAKTNVENLNKYKINRIVTSCPHCFNSLKNEYPAFGGNYTVLHHSQLLTELIKEGKLKPSKELDETVTFHDSCYLGRWNDEYDSPRDALKAIPKTNLVEMSQSFDQSLCCGAGGGRMFMEETIGERINAKRTDQAIDTGASVVAAGCPFCMTMLTDGVKSKEMQDKVRVYDVAELLDEAT